ncbi:MAG: transposase [Cyclobacteriaceae bacterium]|nr:transposase [Cyclobacteriaceae bacterium HetDA_MAG_MS6]
MSTHRIHSGDGFYFVTFTCYRWLNLLRDSDIYDYLRFWFSKLSANGCNICGYVIMPNHMHLVLYLEDDRVSLNKVIGEAKRFLAYEVVKRLKKRDRTDLLHQLQKGVQQNEKNKGKRHQVFRFSFDAKSLKGINEVEQVLDYIHRNPVSGKWNLVDDYVSFPYSSASYYETGLRSPYSLVDYRVVSESSTSDSE